VTDATAPSAPRARLVEEAVAFVQRHGFADVSLRELAAALGTSHRMLIYHFGSKQALYVEVIRSFEAQQRRTIEAFLAEHAGAGSELLRGVWRQVSAPATLAQVRMFFQVCGEAIGDAASGGPAAALLDRIVGDWVEPMAEIERRARGSSLADARADVRVGIAVMRGLLLDLVATGDRRGVDRAFERFLASWRPAPG